MRRTTTIALTLALAALGCSEPPTAQSTCTRLVEDGIAANCQRVTPGGLNARARERYDFDLVSVPGEGGSVLSFDTSEDYEAVVRSYAEFANIAGPHRYGNAEFANIAGPHRYGNANKRIFVQLNEGAALEVGDRARAIVDGL